MKTKILESSYIRFLFSGGIVFILEYALTIFLTELLKIKPHLSYALALFIESLFLFQYHKKITFKFKSQDNRIKLRFGIIFLSSYILNWGLTYLLIKKLTYFVAIPIVTTILSPIIYFAYKKFVFTKN
ncbi:MAG: GtrA family protein [Nanoarchaeota archaeon]|nr:GtrA family protein [Nanoarchaeota archaeon]